jgi:hypothetical protein
MRLTWLDGLGTVLSAVIVGLCAVGVTLGDVPVRGVALIALFLGSAAALAIGPVTVRSGPLRTAWRIGMLVALGLGVAAVVTEHEAVLATFAGVIVALWAVAMLAHAGVLTGSEDLAGDSDDELLGDGPAVNEAQDQWERNRPGPFIPPGPSTLPPAL